MKQRLIFLVVLAGFFVRLAAASAPQTSQPFTAVFWTTTTLHLLAGKPVTFTRRTVYTRDASGNTRSERYTPTKGSLQDVTAPLERVSTNLSSAQSPLLTAHSDNETVQVVDLGGSSFAGFPTQGNRQIFADAGGHITRTLETWFCPSLGLTVHLAGSNEKGDTLNGDLSSLQLDSLSSQVTASVSAHDDATSTIPLVILYRNLFRLVDRMEQDRQANDPSRHVNMAEIEDHLRKKLKLSASEWQTLVATSVKVEQYTRDKFDEAHRFVQQDRAMQKEHLSGPNTQTTRLVTLHKMQVDLNARVQGDVDGLKQTIGKNAADHLEAYLHGPLAASTSAVTLPPAHLRSTQADKEQAR